MTSQEMAKWWCELSDDEQAKFFVEVAIILDSWGTNKGADQLHYIGRHLQQCECSTPGSRSVIEGIFMSMISKEKARAIEAIL